MKKTRSDTKIQNNPFLKSGAFLLERVQSLKLFYQNMKLGNKILLGFSLPLVIMIIVFIKLKKKGFKITDLFGERVSKNFSWSELSKTNTGIDNDPPTDIRRKLKALVKNVLQPLRNRLGIPIIANSVYRSPAVNTKIGGAKTSQHMKGEAADFKVIGKDLKEVYELIVRENIVPYDQVIYEVNPDSKWIHISYKGFNNRKQALLANWSGDKMTYKTYTA